MDRRKLLIGAAASAGAVGCDPRAPALPPLRLAMDLWVGYFPVLLADELGWLREQGPAVEVSIPGNTRRMVGELAAGRVDLICVALADLVNLARGAPVQVLLVSDESSGGDQVLLRPGATLQDRRLVLGTSLGGFGELLLHEFLERRRVAARQVTWVNIDAAEVPAALASGAIDIGHTWEPYASRARAAGARPVFSSAETPGLIPDVVAGLRPTLDRRAPELRRLAVQWFRAQDWWGANPDAGDALLARRLGQAPAWVAAQRAGVVLQSLSENRRLQGGALVPVLERYSTFFVRHGTLTRPLEPAALLRPDLLP